MADVLKRVLVGDANQGRVEILRQILAEEFSTEITPAQHFDEVNRYAATASWNMILVATNLPYPPQIGIDFIHHFNALFVQVSGRSRVVCVFGDDGFPNLLGPSSASEAIFVPAARLGEKERRKIIGHFRQWLGWSPSWPKVKLDNDLLLHEQVRSLTKSRKLDAGEKLLAQLVRGFFICKEVTVGRLGQGKSGSKVFRIRPEPCSAANPEFVLKLIDEEDKWKIAFEITGHQKAREFLAQPFRQHITNLYPTCSPQAPATSDLIEYVASTSGNTWQAVCYGFLGGDRLGQFIDLESVLIAEPSKLSEKVLSVKRPNQQLSFTPTTIRANRHAMLDKVLKWLSDQWYDKAQISQEARPLWETPDALYDKAQISQEVTLLRDTPDAPLNRYPEHPPYRFTGKAKERIIAFLDGFDAQLGERIHLPDGPLDWGGGVARIRELLSKDSGPTGFSKLDDPLHVVLSPTHGDLNAANILLWLDQQEHPFLIDFPFYQESGHVVQDFARLEVEMKFMLLDRQADTPASELPAFDYTPAQMPLWLELEAHLLNDWKQPRPKEDDWERQGYKTNVICCLELIQHIRNTAEDVYRGAGAVDNFHDEYWAALLYHTLRVLGYPSVSLFKRLVAVYSASSILEKMK